MAKPIKETPVLIGKDARRFISEMNQSKRSIISQTEAERVKANFEKIKALVKK